MKTKNNNQRAFFELLKAGLWGNGNPDIRIDGATDWQEVYQLAQEQSVQGIVLQGIETVQGSGLKVHGTPIVPKVLLLQWIGVFFECKEGPFVPHKVEGILYISDKG